MLDAYNQYLSRLLLVFSDLCSTDQEIADCLTLMRVAPPAPASRWTSENVQALIPAAFATANSTSDYASSHVTQATIGYCKAIYQVVKNRKGSQ